MICPRYGHAGALMAPIRAGQHSVVGVTEAGAPPVALALPGVARATLSFALAILSLMEMAYVLLPQGGLFALDIRLGTLAAPDGSRHGG